MFIRIEGLDKMQRGVCTRVIVPAASHGPLGNERRKGISLRRMAKVTRINIVRNEKRRRRTGINRKFTSRVDPRVLRWFGNMKRMDTL